MRRIEVNNFMLLLCILNALQANAVIIIGHRGAAGYAPENTLSAFSQAIECDVDMIECDVRRCASGELVVFHDAQLDRITDGTGDVAAHTLHELQQFKVLGNERIVTLMQMLDVIEHKVKVYIELKDLDIAIDVLCIIDHYVTHCGWSYNDFLIASFDHVQLRDIKAMRDTITTIALMYGIPIGFAACATEINADIVALDSEFITHQFVDDIHNRGMLVYVYTVNQQKDLMRLMNYGIDGIITDVPCHVRDWLKFLFVSLQN